MQMPALNWWVVEKNGQWENPKQLNVPNYSTCCFCLFVWFDSLHPGFQLDWNLLRTFCPSSPNFVRTFGNFLGHFFNTNFYHHKRKLPSALLKLKPGVVLLPFRMVSAVRLIVWLFISWGEWSLSIVVGGSRWGTVFFLLFAAAAWLVSHGKWLFR